MSPVGLEANHGDRDGDPGHVVCQHDPHVVHRCGAEGEVGASGHAARGRPDGLRPVDPASPIQSEEPRLAGPRPVRALGGTRQHAPVQPAVPDRVRRDDGGPPPVPAVEEPDARAPGAALRARRGGQHRPARAGRRQQCGDGDRGTVAGGPVQPPGTSDRRPLYVRDRKRRRHNGRRRRRGRLAGRACPARPSDLAVRRQSRDVVGQHVPDGNDLATLDRAIAAARAAEDRPSLIIVRTHLGYGSPNRQDTFQAHGEPLGEEEVRLTKRALGWPEDKAFYVPDEALRRFREAVARGADLEAAWHRRLDAYRAAFPGDAQAFARAFAGEMEDGWQARLPAFAPGDGPLATREASGKVMNAVAGSVPELIGGSADLDPSTHTMLRGAGDFESPSADGAQSAQGRAGGTWGYDGRNVHFGVREHAMGAAINGMAAHGGVRPFGATFLVFSDYMRPSVRLAALSALPVIYVWTHDSVGLGEDGPTHQPIEHLASLRAIPKLVVLRP